MGDTNNPIKLTVPFASPAHYSINSPWKMRPIWPPKIHPKNESPSLTFKPVGWTKFPILHVFVVCHIPKAFRFENRIGIRLDFFRTGLNVRSHIVICRCQCGIPSSGKS
jgi:hypothetical protein